MPLPPVVPCEVTKKVSATMSLAFMMVSVDLNKHGVVYLSYDREHREANGEIYMWALELLTKVKKYKEYIGFCQFLKIAAANNWYLKENTAASNTEVIYLFYYNNEPTK